MPGVKFAEQEFAGEKVRFKSLTGGAAAVRVIELLEKVEKQPSLIVKIGEILAFKCVVKEDGSPAYKTIEAARADCSIGFFKDFVEPALELSGMGEDIGDTVKNSEAAQ